MATTPAATKGAAKAAPATTFSAGKFTFEVVDHKEAPVAPAFGNAAHPYPFPGIWPKMKHNQEIFLPVSWWTAPLEDGGRGLSVEQCRKAGYLKGKINNLFGAWRKKEENEAVAAGRTLILVMRKQGQPWGDFGDERFPEDGLSMFMQVAGKSK